MGFLDIGPGWAALMCALYYVCLLYTSLSHFYGILRREGVEPVMEG